MARGRVRGVIESVARLRCSPGVVWKAGVNDNPDGIAVRVTDGEFRDGLAESDFRDWYDRTFRSAYRWYLALLWIVIIGVITASYFAPALLENWIVRLPIIAALVGNAWLCWRCTYDWPLDSRLVGFAGPAIAPAILLSAFMFGYLRLV